MRLDEQRLGVVLSVLKAAGARSVLDLGCGEGKLVRALLKEPSFDRVVGLDVTLPDTDAPPPQAASRPGTTPRKQSLRKVRRFISCDEALSGCLSAQSISIRKSFHLTPF